MRFAAAMRCVPGSDVGSIGGIRALIADDHHRRKRPCAGRKTWRRRPELNRRWRFCRRQGRTSRDYVRLCEPIRLLVTRRNCPVQAFPLLRPAHIGNSGSHTRKFVCEPICGRGRKLIFRERMSAARRRKTRPPQYAESDYDGASSARIACRRSMRPGRSSRTVFQTRARSTSA